MGTIVQFPVQETAKLNDLFSVLNQQNYELAIVVKDADGNLTIQQWGTTPTAANGIRLLSEAVTRMAMENERLQ